MNKNLWDIVTRHGIGFDPNFFERLVDAPNFPPHNILQIDDDHYRLTLALAGYRDSEIDIVMHNDILTVSGQKTHNTPDSESTARMLYNGIAFRDFSRQFKVGDYVSVEDASLADGLLQIDLVRRLPEAMKPRRIEIGRSPLLAA